MRKLSTLLMSVAALSLASSAYAGFVNGGFEDGTLNGWTVQGGYYYGNDHVEWGAFGPITQIITRNSGYVDPYNSGFNQPFNDNYMAKLNDIYGGNHVTRISQTAGITAADYNGGASATLYINWGAVMQNPYGHPTDAQPFFNVTVTRGGSEVYNVKHYGNEPGWTLSDASGYWDPIYYSSGQTVLNNLLAGDQVSVELTAGDCSWGGHGGYAYLDGIGTAYVPPPPGVPEAGSTLVMLGMAVTGLLGYARRKV